MAVNPEKEKAIELAMGAVERKLLEKVGVLKPSPVQAVPDEADEKRARVKAVK